MNLTVTAAETDVCTAEKCMMYAGQDSECLKDADLTLRWRLLER